MGTLRQTSYFVVLCRYYIAFVTVCWAASLASAVPIPINNHSFEDEIYTSGDYGYGIQDWTVFGPNSVGTWRPTPDQFDLSTLDGSQTAYFHTGRSAAQQLNTGLVLGQKYHLSALLGAVSSGMYTKGGSLELWAGGTVASGNVVGGTILGSLVVADNQLTPGLFLPFSTEITAPGSGPLGGKLLSVRFVSNGVEAELDNVQLDVEEIPGDYNADGKVDAADYVVYRNTFGQVGSGLAADGNGNGSVEAGDYDYWKARFGQTAGSGSNLSENADVPEPRAWLMMCVVAGGVSVVRRRRELLFDCLRVSLPYRARR